jgi:hypothetical protein
MSTRSDELPTADAGQLDPGVGRPAPERDEAAEHALLERAAFAAGLVVESWIAWGGAWVYPREAPANEDGEFPIFKWAPLDDDGDALRLAVDVGLVVDTSRPSAGQPFRSHVCAQMDFTDRRAATRRAIVRAAAESCKTPNLSLART